MTAKREGLSERRVRALTKCQEDITWYENKKKLHRGLHHIMLATAVILGTLTPVFILLSDAKPAQAIVAVLAAVATGLKEVFHWKENYARFAYAGEVLKAEKIKFETTAYESDDDESKAIESFVAKINRIRVTETAEWRKVMSKELEDKHDPSVT